VYIARLICSDEACAERAITQIEVATLEELEALACDCGCCYQVLGIPDHAEQPAVVIELRPRAGRGSLDEAA